MSVLFATDDNLRHGSKLVLHLKRKKKDDECVLPIIYQNYTAYTVAGSFCVFFIVFCLAYERVYTLTWVRSLFIPDVLLHWHCSLTPLFKKKYYTWPVIPTFCLRIYRTPLCVAFLSHFAHNSNDTLPWFT